MTNSRTRSSSSRRKVLIQVILRGLAFAFDRDAFPCELSFGMTDLKVGHYISVLPLRSFWLQELFGPGAGRRRVGGWIGARCCRRGGLGDRRRSGLGRIRRL